MNCCFNVGDEIYCEKKKMRGFITRLNALGLSKCEAVGVQWEDKTRETIIGSECCNHLTVTKACKCDDDCKM